MVLMPCSAQVCGLLQDILGGQAKCSSVPDAFSQTSITFERDTVTSTFQWHQYLPLRKYAFGRAFLGKVCTPSEDDEARYLACNSVIQNIDHASHVHVDFDAKSQTVMLSVYWSAGEFKYNDAETQHASNIYRKASPQDRLELGVLQAEEAKEPGEMTLGGFLTVMGEDDRPSEDHIHSLSRRLC